jgi:hypothetical protein
MLSSEVDAGGAAGRAAPARRFPRWILVLVALAAAALFAWNVRRTWFLSDDAFISFRYARNLVDGHGLVWNPGERVEGYTNFAWVLLMAAGMCLGLEPEVLSNALGVACGAGLLFAVLRFAARGRSLSSPFPWLAVLVLAANRSFAAWCTGGLETMLFALLVFLGFARLFSGERRRDVLACSLLFAGAALTRPEGLLFGSLAFALLLLEVVLGRRPRSVALTWLVPFAALVGAHLAWRRAYYGEWLPNTFHAKVGGLWLEQGWRYFSYFHETYRIGWFLPLALPALLGPDRRAAASVGFVLLVYGAYVLAVGGDLFELRFLVHVFALLYWLLVEGLATLVALGQRWRRAPVVLSAAGVALIAATYLGFDRVPGNLFGLQTIDGIDRYTRQRQDEGRALRDAIERGVLPRELVLCVGGAGAVPYYTGWTTVDRRGLSDATIARLPGAGRGLVGHEHDAPYDYLVQRRVAVFDYYNQLLVKRAGLRQLRGPFVHDGHPLAMRAIPLGERALVFGTFLDDAELARLFPGAELIVLGGG